MIVFYSGANAAAWKQALADWNDLAGDFFEKASFIGVDVRFFAPILAQYPGAAEGKAAVFKKGGEAKIVAATLDDVRQAVNSYK